MNDQERQMIEGLFDRLRQAETQAGPRDAEADRLIQDLTSRQPGSAYMLAQVVLMQEQGMRNLQTRIEDLERDLSERAQKQESGGFLGGLFGGGAKPQPAAQPSPRAATGGGWSNSQAPAMGAARMAPGAAPAAGGGFMAGAMQTAVGVAGGMLLANAVSGLFSSPAEAAEVAEPPADMPAEDFHDGEIGGEDPGAFEDFGDDEGF